MSERAFAFGAIGSFCMSAIQGASLQRTVITALLVGVIVMVIDRLVFQAARRSSTEGK